MRDLDKCNYYNFPNYRSLFESVLNIHVLEALQELQQYDTSEIYIIGGLAVSYYSKPYRSSDIDILVKDKNKLTFNNEYLDIYEPSDLGISIEQFDDIAKTRIVSDNFNIVSPSHLMTMFIKTLDKYLRPIGFLVDNTYINNEILLKYSGQYYNRYYRILIYSRNDYNMKFIKTVSEYSEWKIYEGVSGFGEVDSAFDDWVYYTKATNQVLIGGLALLNHINNKSRTTTDVDFIFLSEDDIPSDVVGFVKNRPHSFKHKKTHVEIETLTPSHIKIDTRVAKLVFATAYDKGDYKIASPSAIVALKLDRLSLSDINDIKILVANFDIDIEIFKPFLSRIALRNIDFLKNENISL